MSNQDAKAMQKMAVEATIGHITAMMKTSGAVLLQSNRQAGLAVQGTATAILKKNQEITEQVLTLLGYE